MEGGVFPEVSQLFNSMSCNHCIDPECLRGSSTNSYVKFENNGIVWHDDDSCIGCQYCTWNCPYEVPVMNYDRGIVTKCDMCHDKLAVGETPACVQACPAGAIEIDSNEKLENLVAFARGDSFGGLYRVGYHCGRNVLFRDKRGVASFGYGNYFGYLWLGSAFSSDSVYSQWSNRLGRVNTDCCTFWLVRFRVGRALSVL